MSKSKSGLDPDAGKLFQPTGQQDSKPVSQYQQASKPAPDPLTRIGCYVAGEKTKATFYFSEETLDELDMAWPAIKRLAGERKRLASKSLLVEAALQIALEDWQEKGIESALAKVMSRLANDRL